MESIGDKRRNAEILYVPSAVVLMFVCLTVRFVEQRFYGCCKPCFIV